MKTRRQILTAILLLIAALSTAAFAQVSTTGRLAGVVTDSKGALVPKAVIVATKNETKEEFKTTANEEGGWSIPSVPNGTYTISITVPGFKTTVLTDVKVDAGQVATANSVLEPGGANEQVVISGGGEILQTETANVATTIVGRQIVELPFVTRDALQLVLTLPGVQSPGVPRTSSINGLPKGSVNLTLDGVNIQDNFLRSSDGFFTQVQPKSDAVQEVTVSTAVPGAESAGEGAAQVKFVTKSGTPEFHGGVFWQYRSPRFNSNYYFNNIDGLPRDSLFLRQFGGHIGGPILIPKLIKSRDKAFFFINYEEFRLPQAYGSLSAVGNILVLTPEARSGLFTYKDSGGTIRTINLLTEAAKKDCDPNTAGLQPCPSTIDPTLASGLAKIDAAVRTSGALKSRIAGANDFNRLDYQFQDPGNNIRRFPTARFDWNITKNQHLEFIHNYQFYFADPDAVNGQNAVGPGLGIVVGGDGTRGSIYRDSFSYAMAHRWTISSRLVNELRATSGGNGTSVFTREFAPGLFDFWGGYAVTGGTFLGAQGNGTGAFYNRRTTSRRNTPTKGLSDNLTFIKGTHILNFGASYLRINSFTSAAGTQIVPQVTLGITSDDPMNNNFFTTSGAGATFPGASSTQLSNAQSLYATLVGRVSAVNRSVSLVDGKYVFDSFNEYNHQNEFALYGQDAWKLRPNLTLNYGLRWELEPSPTNDNDVYTRTGFDGIFGISGAGHLFQPGTFSGQPTQFRLLEPGEKGFETRHNDFAPSFGFAYSPNFKTGLLRMLAGESGKTVIRGGYSIAFTREGFNAYTAMFGSNEGGTVNLNVSPSLTPGIFPAGSVLFKNRATFPALTPPTDTSKYPFTPLAGSGGTANDFDAKLKAGYTQSFSLGLQRELGKDTAVEIRFVRTRGTHLWRQYDLNEVNIFENGFIDVFRAAARNLAIFNAAFPDCGQTGKPACNNYSDSLHLPGQVPVLVLTTAIGSNNDTSTATRLLQGQAGAVANSIAFNLTRMNRLIVANINGQLPGFTQWTRLPLSSGCSDAVSTSQTCRISNYFLVNPQVTGATTGGAFLMTQGTDTSFNALQIEVRRRMSKGLLFQGSYQFGKALSNAFVSSSSVFSQPRTLRDPTADRTFSPWDIRHSFKFDYIYELPFGPGKHFNSSNWLLNGVIGHWQIGGVTRIQSGPATLLTSGGRATVNQNDAGVVLHNMTLNEFQKLVKIRKDPGGIVYWLPQSVIDNTVAAFNSATGAPLDPNAPYIGPPLTAGQLGDRIVFHGPATARFDFNVAKRIPVGERVNLEGRVSFLNAFNRANFFLGDADSTIRSISAASQAFGQTRSAYRDITVSGTNDPGGRLIEFQFRLNF
jgi:Carboxypeptidase regulatory-like domain